MNPTRQPTPVTTTDPMNPAALLRGAAIYLQVYGWTRGQFFELLDRNNDQPFVPACASGAIMTAATGRCLTSGFTTLHTDHEDPDERAALTAMQTFADWLRDGEISIPDVLTPSSIDIIGDWNDDKGRTLDEVIEVLTDAARDWETAHPTGGAR